VDVEIISGATPPAEAGIEHGRQVVASTDVRSLVAAGASISSASCSRDFMPKHWDIDRIDGLQET